MKWTSLNELREQYLAFFEQKAHLRLPSFPLLPHNDASLLLINSGMAPMKKWFAGVETPPNNRVTTCQKCIRTPDIENVGKTARHGTFFEMLGNFSFGDYFKKEATAWAWEFITTVLELPFERLWVSVYEQDDETKAIWIDEIGVSPERIVKLGKADNFWEIGAGPCGPCSEIYFDRGEEYGCDSENCAVGCDCDRYVEFWNLVFTQFDNDGNGNYSKLASPNIDTGMGLERLACIVQGVHNLFEVDTVQNIMTHISKIAGVPYHQSEKTDVSLRVITDHIRSTVFLLADGVMPANEGRGYVLKRLLRRAARHGYLLGITRPFLYEVVETVIQENQCAYPELTQKQDFLKKIIKLEEENFSKTIVKGMELLNGVMDALDKQGDGGKLSGEEAFRLYDTYGFPLDLTREIATEKKISIDETAFISLMEQQKKRARDARSQQKDVAWQIEQIDLGDVATSFVGYTTLHTHGKLLAIIANGESVGAVTAGQKATLVFDQTSFYAESGGQISDKGVLRGSLDSASRADVLDVQKTAGNIILHHCEVMEGSFALDDTVEIQVMPMVRDAIKRNHTAAHLVQAALREVLGQHVHQAGQLVNAEIMRFDFSHFQAMSKQELEKVEHIVNFKVMESLAVKVREMPIEKAKEMGAMALFGEKYGDSVRVVNAGDYAIELCGGTHVDNTSQIGIFTIVSEASVAAGVRRIEAKTGPMVLQLLQAKERLLQSSAEVLKLQNIADLPNKCSALLEENRTLQKKLEQMRDEAAKGQLQNLTKNKIQVGECQLIVACLDRTDKKTLGNLGDRLKDQSDNVIALLASKDGDSGTLLCVCGKNAITKGAHAGNIVKEIAMLAGGKGGGRPDRAMAGVGDTERLGVALQEVQSCVQKMLQS